jgi:autotransporter translocation and assembly factor TamB
VFGKRFQINSGALRFDGSTDFDPDVYLSATEKPQAAGLSPVSVSVTGTISAPVVAFSSDVCPGETGAITYLVSGRCAADDPDLAQESADAQGQFASGIVGGVLTLGAQSQLKGIAPRIAVGRSEQGGQRVAAGFSSESLIPKFMRKLVTRVYVEGGVSGPPSSQATAGENTTQSTALEFLIELYFPHNIVGSGRFGPQTWGTDVIWEP